MFFESFLLNLTVIIVLLLALIFDYVTKYFSYWYVRHIPYKTSVPFFGSDYHRVFGLRGTTDEVNKLYAKYPEDRFVGCIKSRIPDLIIKETDVIKRVLETDFANFHCRGLGLDKSQDVCLRNNLFYAEGEKWTVLREALEYFVNGMSWNPKESLHNCLTGINGDTNVQRLLTNVLDIAFEDLLLENNVRIEKKSIITNIRTIVQRFSIIEKLKTYLKNIFPSLYLLFGLITLPGQPSKETLEVLEDLKLTKELKKIRSTFQLDIKGKYNKFKSESDVEFAFSILSSFITEGYIPCLNVLTALLYEIAKNSQVQQKMRDSTKRSNDDYLDKVIYETLRLHPSYSIITRKCQKVFKYTENDLHIDKGITITIPIEAMQRDNKNYKDANVFNPDRFLGDGSDSYTFLPFGAGPRKCIGERLSLQIVKEITRAILEQYEIQPCRKTPSQLPVSDHNFGRIVNKDIWLTFLPIES